MIALVGQSLIDRVRLPGSRWVVRLGGAPIFAGRALAGIGARAVITARLLQMRQHCGTDGAHDTHRAGPVAA